MARHTLEECNSLLEHSQELLDSKHDIDKLLDARDARCRDLAKALHRLELEALDLRDCVQAAAAGHPELAEAYVAGEKLGIQRFGPTVAQPLYLRRCLPHTPYALAWVAWVSHSDDPWLLLRLQLTERCAPHFVVRKITLQDRAFFLGGKPNEVLPGSLFATAYTAPKIDQVVRPLEKVTLFVSNESDHVRDFEGVLLGLKAPDPTR